MIINLTQHPATPEQIAAGVVDLTGEALIRLRETLTFGVIPTGRDISARARFIAGLVGGNSILTHGLRAEQAMIGGAPFFMSALENAIIDVGVTPLYAFSVRDVIETIAADGSVTKTAVFKHAGFVDTL